MKPTSAMFHRLRARPDAADAETAPLQPEANRPAMPPVPEHLDPRRRHPHELRHTLARTKDEAQRTSLLEELHKLEAASPEGRRKASGFVGELANALAEATLATVTPATPGHVAVRVTGVGEREARIPLGGLRVRASARDQHAEGITDELGFVLLHVDVKSSFSVDVLSPAGEVVGRTTSRLAENQFGTLEVSVAHKPELEETFSRGRAWSESIRRRAEQLDASRKADVHALEQRVGTLEATVARLVGRLEALSRAETVKGGDQPTETGGQSNKDKIRNEGGDHG